MIYIYNKFLHDRFMESEVDVNDIITSMHVIATVPELYHILVDLNTIHSLLQLLTHENTGLYFCNFYTHAVCYMMDLETRFKCNFSKN